MTLIEALIALAIATFTIGGTIEAARLAAGRSEISALDINAIRVAANLVATANVSRPGHYEGHDRDYTWRLDVIANEPEFGPSAVDVSATVRMTRSGFVSEKTISTLKLK